MTAINFLQTPVCGASLVFFRVGFGMLMLSSLLRFWARGWIHAYYIAPSYHFSYAGLSWIKPWTAYGLPAWTLYAHVLVLCFACVAIAGGWFYRSACFVFFVGFTYLELIDKSFYLNHYYAISLFALLMCFLPLDQSFSYKVPHLVSLPRWSLWVLRLQVSLIYFFAGLAKVNPDWLWAAEPLRRWLPALSNTPWIGPVFLIPLLPWLMSWGGMAFDITIPFWMSRPRWRKYAYGAILVFHALTAWWFPIGLFPWLMMFLALVFFAPDWPLSLARLRKGSGGTNFLWTEAAQKVVRLSWGRRWVLGLFFVGQCLVPLRHWLYPGSVLWTEEGFRFAWHVMLIEKTGWVEFTLKDPATGKFWVVSPHELSPLQQRMMSTQPDMILQYAHHLVAQRVQVYPRLEVYAESYAALNGRRSQYLIDPQANLRDFDDNLWPKSFVVPLDGGAGLLEHFDSNGL